MMDSMMADRVRRESTAKVRQFPREADAEFPVVSDKRVGALRKTVAETFPVGCGKLELVDDPFARD